MKLNKNTQIILGVGALAVVGYFVMKNNTPKKANASGKALPSGVIAYYPLQPQGWTYGGVCPKPEKIWVFTGKTDPKSNEPIYFDEKTSYYHWLIKSNIQQVVKPNYTKTVPICGWVVSNVDPNTIK